MIRLFNRMPVWLTAALVLIVALAACGGNDRSVAFTSPADGADVTSPVRIVMSADNFTIEQAGGVREGAGHFHVMVDTPCLSAGTVIPKDETHLHFGDGSTEAELTLAPGAHTLCLQAADGVHTALEGMTSTITVNVR